MAKCFGKCSKNFTNRLVHVEKTCAATTDTLGYLLLVEFHVQLIHKQVVERQHALRQPVLIILIEKYYEVVKPKRIGVHVNSAYIINHNAVLALYIPF